MFGWLKSKKKEEPAAKVLPEISGLALGYTVQIDPLLGKIQPEGSLFELEDATMVLEGHGIADMGDGTFIHRFYGETVNFIQFMVQNGAAEGDDAILFFTKHVFHPGSENDWNEHLDRMKQVSYKLRSGETFDRFWFDDSEKAEDPVQFLETVWTSGERHVGRDCQQICMMFRRELEDGSPELLLVNAEIDDRGDRSVSLLVGVPLSTAQYSV
ncbi:DUF2491 family protein [Thalassospira xianhensis]|uniref:DUF2491 domain-containing protein n=1 Tax=Thalassospira xianhensis MCCC 1A02616 TaxID=1177929 RepID=A0A367UHK4_9PROT|nr:DUF2491 family protein [Thalassospira xianhensis]RCK07786.1 hypothetical protein TH5_01710 [Thalassospira xianhensis MCCC 1A02616]